MAKNSPVHPLHESDASESKADSLATVGGDKSANESQYLSDSAPDKLQQACIAMLSSRVFSDLLSNDKVDQESIDAANRVATILNAQGEKIIPVDQTSGLLADRIAFTSRGKRLHQRCSDLTQRLALVTKAMLMNRCLTAQYNLRSRELHPYGLVIREPKIYVLATETPVEQADTPENTAPVIKQYLLNRFTSLTMSDTHSSVPEDFSVKHYIDAGHMDVNIPKLVTELGQQFELVLRVNEQNNDALIRDLQDFSLDNQQRAFINTDAQNNCLLTVPNQAPTYALSEWILGRTDRVEVIAPAALRHYLLDRLQATSRMYASDPEQISVSEDNVALEAEHDKDESENPSNRQSIRRSNFASCSSKNTLVARYVLRILTEVRINHQLLDNGNIWAIDPLFDGAVRAFINQEDVAGFKDWVDEQAKLSEPEEADPLDPFSVNIHESGDLLQLSYIEKELLCLAALIHQNPELVAALRLMGDNPTEHDAIEIISTVIKQPAAEVADALRDVSILRKAGLIGRCPVSIISIQDLLNMPAPIANNLFTYHEKTLGILSGIVISSPEPELDTSDFEHLATQATMAISYLNGAINQNSTGCNILLWGPPGTGKTQLARHLIKQLATISSWEVMSVASDGSALNELARISSYRLIQSVLGGSKESAIILDEAENILETSHSVSEAISKASLNDLLENNPVPSIWISNSVEEVDPAYLRRFDVVIEIPVPEISAKKRVAQRILNDIPFNGELLDAFLKRREVGPAFLQKVRRVAQLTGADTEQTVGTLATNLLHSEIAVSGGTPAVLPKSDDDRKALSSLPYDFSLINASEDLGALAATLVPGVNVKFCLYGPPGTGKTAWAKQLAEQMGKPSHVVQASDIQDKYVGESEKRIASAFSEAESKKAILIFDEVDTFLSDRSTQNNSYAVGITNQFLTSLENYNGLVVCSTNLMDNLDSAALRRFDFKVKFNYLTAAQANQMLVSTARLLGMELDVSDIVAGSFGLKADTYAPGDFAVVLKRSQIRTEEVTLAQLYADVTAEAEMRGTKENKAPMGFI